MSVEGRTVNLTLTPSGQAVTQGAVDRALSAIPELLEYQLIQTGPSAFTLNHVSDESATRHVAGTAREALQAVYGPGANITPIGVTAIAPDPPGKFRLCKSQIPIEADALLDPRFAPRKYG